ncbi:MAG: hypothetical protein PHV16_01880 [Candidatus Nanoarchaeia archaeon]|nr:hypothetical protein [Candidatus Nanoarchaeia archaeon]
MDEKENKKTMKHDSDEGKILVRAIVEIVGKPKEHVENSLKVVVEKIKEGKDLKIIDEKIFDAEPYEKMFSAFVELELLLNNIDSLIGFCFDYMPSSLEIVEPEKMKFNSNELAAVLNDMVGKLQNINVRATQNNIEQQSIKKSMFNLLKNMMLILLKFKDMDIEHLSKNSGVDAKALKPILDSMINEKLIELKDNIYSMKKDG